MSKGIKRSFNNKYCSICLERGIIIIKKNNNINNNKKSNNNNKNIKSTVVG